MAICLFSLAGVPPLVGFFAKLSVLQALGCLRANQRVGVGCVCSHDVLGWRVLIIAGHQSDVL
jgi:NADH:ubiquinone oxidoreductase subunit 5 (subunit L)/multisubunit Na+/H+ antiporter MnhA subunit